MSTTDLPADEAEKGVFVRAMTSGGRELDEISLTGRDFADPRVGDAFDVMRALHRNGASLDVITVDDAISARVPSIAGWVLGLDTLAYPASIVTYAAIVAKTALRKRYREAGAALAQLPMFESSEEMVNYVRRLIDEAGVAEVAKVETLGDAFPKTLEVMASAEQFIPTEWQRVNDIIGGLRPGALYVVGARPGVGKSVFAQGLATALAQYGYVAFSSLEMSRNEVVERFIAERTGVSIGRIKNKRMQPSDWEEIRRAQARITGLNIAIDDRTGIGPEEVRTFVRAVSKRGRLAGVIVDYLQLMTIRSEARRFEQVAEFSRQLKILAKDFHVPVVALSQLNRESESQLGRGRPRVSQLRESGAIEQDADVVMLLHREEDEAGNLSLTEIHVDVQKNRHGRTGHVTLSWDGAHSRVSDWGAA